MLETRWPAWRLARDPLSEAVATRYIHQVTATLDYVHDQHMTHQDIKPANRSNNVGFRLGRSL